LLKEPTNGKGYISVESKNDEEIEINELVNNIENLLEEPVESIGNLST
jgi:hypothetical protein